MPQPTLPGEVPEQLYKVLGLTPQAGDVGGKWSVGIDGLGFILETLDQEAPFEFRSYEVQSIPQSKPRIDQADEPGEQTLAAWWARAQHSWHEGAGQRVFDSEISSRYRFCNSRGLDPWVRGELKMLKDTEQMASSAHSDWHVLAVDGALIYTANGVITKDTDPDGSGETAESTHSGTAINSIVSDGQFVYAAFASTPGIKKIPIDSLAAWVNCNDQQDVELLAFVKGRLIGAKANSLYEYDLGSTNEPNPFYSDPATEWTWSGITDSGPAIYFSGYAGERSEIYAARLTAQDIPYASVATLGAMRSVWQAPEGEQIVTIKGYLGQQVLIGTTRGIRIANIVTGEGDLSVSPLLVKTDEPVYAIEPQLEFAWFSWSNYDATHTGLGRVDLGTNAFASDLMYEDEGIVTEIVSLDGRRYFIVYDGSTGRLIKEHDTNLVSDAFIQNCDVRFSTTETKVVRFFDVLFTGVGKWSLEIAINHGSWVPLTTENPVSGYHEEIIDIEGTKFGARITFHRDGDDATKGPILHEWRLRADPRSPGRFRYLVPIMVYDYVDTLTGGFVGYDGMALDALNHLKGLFYEGRDFWFHPLESGVPGSISPIEVTMEDFRFKTFTPPDQARGFGGMALAVMREIR